MEKSYIELSRTSQYVNSLRNYEIYVDDALTDKIPNGAKKTIEVSSGKHNIFAKIDWCKSQKIDLDLKPGEIQKFLCGSKLVGSKKWLSLFYAFSKNKWVFLEPYSKVQTEDYQDTSWDSLHKKGFLNFIVKEGILGWGIYAAAFFFIVNLVLHLNDLSLLHIILSAIFSFIIFSIVGVVGSTIIWYISKKQKE